MQSGKEENDEFFFFFFSFCADGSGGKLDSK